MLVLAGFVGQADNIKLGAVLLKDQLRPNVIISGSMLSEPVRILAVQPFGESVKIIGQGLRSNSIHQPILSPDQLASLQISPEREPFDGDSHLFRLGIEAWRLTLAYEYDPYFSLSIARVDPLPHQLEAVYDNFLKSPRIRFLLADDPGAGKTIMAGLLIKELKVRGLINRTLIVCPANLTFQWQRELKDKFREQFEVIRSDVLRANYGSNPWQDRNQVITSVSWVSRVEDAKQSLLRSQWDLVIVDEAHKMSAYSADKKTLAYQLGENLSEMTDHYLMMTATPHKGDPDNFCLFLALLDRDVYADVKSLEEAMKRNSAPFYLRRPKEALVKFPDPDTGKVERIFTNRFVQTVDFHLNESEGDFYYDLTRYVEEQSSKAEQDNSARGRALGFTMAMLQRRFASSVCAARRSLERMRDKRRKILENPEAHRQAQMAKQLPDDFEDLTDEEQQEIMDELEGVVASVDPHALRAEIVELERLIAKALDLEKREVESKLAKLREVLTQHGIFADPQMRLLLFTEHRDTLDYLVHKLREEWGLTVTQIHGGMKIGDRDTPHTRIYAEREFRENTQVMVATEAAGEGINLQFCWFMINYDIPWNPMRLEQRMGRIHRYGQEKDCLILNFVATNTREGRVLQKLFERLRAIEDDLDPQRTGKVFNVLGDIFPSNQLERMVRDMYARSLTEKAILDRIVHEVDTTRFRSITESTLEGLAKRELNLSYLVGKSAEAKERRLVPEVVEDFFTAAAPVVGVNPAPVKGQDHVYRVGRIPRTLWPTGDRLEAKFGKLGREYKHVVFNKELLKRDATLEWVTPGHPLFESIRDALQDTVQNDLRHGAIFYDLHHAQPYRLDTYVTSIRDGLGRWLHRRLFVVQVNLDGTMLVRQPTIFLELAIAEKEAKVPEATHLPVETPVEQFLVEQALDPFRAEIAAERHREVAIIKNHIDISLRAIIDRVQVQFANLMAQREGGSAEQGLDGRIKMLEDRLFELNGRFESRLAELDREQHCTIADIECIGRAWVLPHPERNAPAIAPMVRDEEIERIAVDAVFAYERARGWDVESVEEQNRGFDLISRRPHPEDPKTFVEVRFIEVKGRAGVGEIALSSNEYKSAERLKKDYWLYVVYNCGGLPSVHIVQDPGRLTWNPVQRVEHYSIGASAIMKSAGER